MGRFRREQNAVFAYRIVLVFIIYNVSDTRALYLRAFEGDELIILAIYYSGVTITLILASMSVGLDMVYKPENDGTTEPCTSCSRLHPETNYAFCSLCSVCIQGRIFHSSLLSCCIGKHNRTLYKVIILFLLLCSLTVGIAGGIGLTSTGLTDKDSYDLKRIIVYSFTLTLVLVAVIAVIFSNDEVWSSVVPKQEEEETATAEGEAESVSTS